MKRILIATDGSSGGHEAVEQGVEIAAMFDAETTFVAVRPKPLPIAGDPYYQQAVSGELARLRPVVAAAVRIAAERGLHAEGEILEGNAADEIVALAASRDVDLIVVGNRGHGAVASAVLGSVSHKVIHEARCPVLVAKQRSEAAHAEALNEQLAAVS